MICGRMNRSIRIKILHGRNAFRHSDFRCKAGQICFFQRIISYNIQIRHFLGMQGRLIDGFQIFRSGSIYRNNPRVFLIFVISDRHTVQIIRQGFVRIPQIQCLPVPEKRLFCLFRLFCGLYHKSGTADSINCADNARYQQNGKKSFL